MVVDEELVKEYHTLLLLVVEEEGPVIRKRGT